MNKKSIVILQTDKLLRHFGVKEHSKHTVQYEMQGESNYGYLIYTLEGRAIVVYRHECRESNE